MRYLKLLVLTASFFALVTTAHAYGHDDQPTENPVNLSLIDATTYFQSLGWNYTDGAWTGTVTWDPLGEVGSPGLTIDERDIALGAGAAVAVLDGFANEFHIDLPFNPDPNVDPATDSVVFAFNGVSYSGPDLHGTHTSGIVGARLNGFGTSGVAPMARILNYAIFDDRGWIGVDEDALLSNAVFYGASVANMSYGPIEKGDFSSASSLAAINNHKNDIVVVKAAGNDGVDLFSELLLTLDSDPLTNLIIVGSVETLIDEEGEVTGQIAWYSNTPGHACIALPSGCVIAMMDIFMVAPGGSAGARDENGYINGIWSTDELGGYYRISGTSMAAPHVAGAVALLHSQWPVLKTDPEITRQILFDTATDLGVAGVDPIYGQGLLNVARAMSPIGAPTFKITPEGGGLKVKADDGKSSKTTHDVIVLIDSPIGIIRDSHKIKSRKTSTWGLADTSMMVRRGLAALTETDTTVSVFDDYRRDFPVALSSLLREGRSEFSGRLEQRIASNSGSTAYDVPGRDDLYLAVTQDFRSLGVPVRAGFMGDFRAAGVDAFDLRVFAGSGNGLPLLYSPGVIVGGMSSAGGATSGVNPIFGFAAGEEFTGVSVDELGPFRFAAGYARNERREPYFEPYRADAMAASATLSLNALQKVNVTLTDLGEHGGVFGSRSRGALTLGRETRTRAMSLSWDHAGWHGLSLAASMTLGLSEGKGDGLLTLDKGTISDAFHLGLARHGLLSGRDRVAFSISQPLRVRSGSFHLYADKAFDANGVIQMQSETISLTPSGREFDFQLEYRYTQARGGEFLTFAYHALDAGHIAGREESGLGMKYQIRF